MIFTATTIVQYKVLLPQQFHIVELQSEHMQLERNGCLWRLEAEKNLHPDRIICYCIKFILFSVYKREKIGAAKKTSPKKPFQTWKRDTLGYRGGHFSPERVSSSVVRSLAPQTANDPINNLELHCIHPPTRWYQEKRENQRKRKKSALKLDRYQFPAVSWHENVKIRGCVTSFRVLTTEQVDLEKGGGIGQ